MTKRNICSLCRTKDNFIVRYKLADFNIVECKNCKLLARSVVLSKREIDNLYSKDYFCELQKDYFSAGITKDFENSLRVEDFKNRFGHIVKYSQLKKRNLLDIGCGTGVFLKVVKDAGWKAKGVEVSRYAADIANKKFKLDVLCKPVEEAHFSSGQFDVVTGWDLIEHVEDPGLLMKEISRITKRKGFVAFQTTMVDSLLFLIADTVFKLSFGKISKLVKMAYPIHHSNHFSRKTLKELLKRNRFKIIKTINAEMYYEETSLPKIFLPFLKLLGKLSTLNGKTIELFIIGQKK